MSKEPEEEWVEKNGLVVNETRAKVLRAIVGGKKKLPDIAKEAGITEEHAERILADFKRVGFVE